MEKFITYKLESGKSIRIPSEDIERNMRLGISKEEAITIWLEDEGYLENEEQNGLDKKAKDNKITATIHGARKEPTQKRVVVRKTDTTKETLIAELAEFLRTRAENVNVENIGKLISFDLGTDHFKLDLIRQRKPKN